MNDPTKVTFQALPSVTSNFTVVKELLLIGGSPNNGHGGIAPTQTLIVRGAAPSVGVQAFTNLAADPNIATASGGNSGNGLFPTDRFPAQFGLVGTPPEIAAANSTFVVETQSVRVDSTPGAVGAAFIGGTLGQFSNLSTLTPEGHGIAIDNLGIGVSHVDGAITANGLTTGNKVKLTGGVTLDHGTAVTIGKTEATNNYFIRLPNTDAKFNGSLVSVIHQGPKGPVSLSIDDRALAVYDGSIIIGAGIGGGSNKALLSVLDSRLTGPGSVPLIDIDAAKGITGSSGTPPIVNVTSAVVVRSTVPLDRALLVASAPLLALTNATMMTTSHFADLAGNKNQALTLQASALVGLNAASLAIQNGNLLNLNGASATINGYLFSLAGAVR